MLAWGGFPGIATHPWAYPALEVVHIVGIALLLGNLVLLELRLWGIGQALAVRDLARMALPLALAGFLVAAVSGLTMFTASPGELLGNRAFVVKMVLLMLAGANAGWFHGRGGLQRQDGWAKAQTVVSIGLWLAIMTCGRWIAYL